MDDLNCKTLKTNVLIDIISFLKSFGSLEEYQTQSGPQSRLTLTIADEEDRTINCLLWGDVVANAYWSKQDDIEPPIIIAIQFARIDIKDGNIQISNTYNATKVSYNPDIPQAKQLLDRLHRTPISHPRSFTQIIAQDTRLSSVRSIIDLAKRIHISEIIPSQQVLKHSDMKEASQTQSCQVSDTDAMQTTLDTCPSMGVQVRLYLS